MTEGGTMSVKLHINHILKGDLSSHEQADKQMELKINSSLCVLGFSGLLFFFLPFGW